jgi:hypothetical protein
VKDFYVRTAIYSFSRTLSTSGEGHVLLFVVTSHMLTIGTGSLHPISVVHPKPICLKPAFL